MPNCEDVHPLIAWFDREVKVELESINRKLDWLQAHTISGTPGSPRKGEPLTNRAKVDRLEALLCKAKSSQTLGSPEVQRQECRSKSATKSISQVAQLAAKGSQSTHTLPDPAAVSGLELVLTSPPTRTKDYGDVAPVARLEKWLSRTKSRLNGDDRLLSDEAEPDRACDSTKFCSMILQTCEVSSTRGTDTKPSPSKSTDLTDGLTAVTPMPLGDVAAPEDHAPSLCDTPVRRNSRRSIKEKEVEHAQYLLSRGSRPSLRARVWNFLDSPESSRAAGNFARMSPPLLLFTVCISLSQVFPSSPWHGVPAAVCETTIDCMFLVEFLLRLSCCPNLQAFFTSGYSLIDFLAAVPLIVRVDVGFVIPPGNVEGVKHGILLCFVPIIRLLKTLRRFEKLHLLVRAFQLAAEALPVLLFILALIAMVFAVFIYTVEPRDNITSLPAAMWFTIVTMTTVGYGDVTPATGPGHFIAGILVIVTVLYMAIPLGIIGNAFTVTWDARDRILLMKRTRDRLQQWGYSAHDIPVLFQLSDKNNDGELDIQEFRQLLTRMQIGFSEERILNLFHSFDKDNSGTVDDGEFVRALFPEKFHEIYIEDTVDPDSP